MAHSVHNGSVVKPGLLGQKSRSYGKNTWTCDDNRPSAEKLRWLEQVVIATNKRVDEYNRRAKAEDDAKKTKLLDEDRIRKEISTWQITRVRA